MYLPGGFRLSTCGQAFQPILSDRLEHYEVWLLAFLLRLLQQILVDKRNYPVEHIHRLIIERLPEGFYCFEYAATDEHCEPSKEALFQGTQQVIAPLNGVTEGLLPLMHVPGPLRQDLEAMLQACQEGLR